MAKNQALLDTFDTYTYQGKVQFLLKLEKQHKENKGATEDLLSDTIVEIKKRLLKITVNGLGENKSG